MNARAVLISLGLSTPLLAQVPYDPAVLGREVRHASTFGEAWLAAEVEGVTVLTTTSESGLIRVFGDHPMRARALEAFWPTVPSLPKPISVYCATAKEFAAITPTGNPRSSGVMSTRLAPGGAPALLANLGVETPVGGSTIMNGIDRQMQNFQVVVLKYQRLGARPPSWLEVGLEKLISEMEGTRTAISFPANKSDATLAVRKTGSPEELKKALAAGTFFPLGQLLANANIRPSVQAANEAYEFMHLCLFGEPGKFREPFLALVAAQREGKRMDESAFTAIFGRDSSEMLLELWKYTAVAKSTSYKLVAADGKPLPAAPRITVRKATDEELGQIAAIWRSAPPRP